MIFSNDVINGLIDTIRHAGSATLAIREKGLEPTRKQDGSPVTQADHASQHIIVEGLAKLTPTIPVIAEEAHDYSFLHNHDTYWLVDPLDGTRDYITGHIDFSINVGLIVDGEPKVGCIYAPARDDLIFGDTEKVFRYLKGTKTNIPLTATPEQATKKPPRVVLSHRDAQKNEIDRWVATGHIASYNIHASAYKYILLAVGEADMFIRTSTTSEWDTAAGDAILKSLGGQTLTPDGRPLRYRKPRLENSTFIAIRSDFDLDNLALFWSLLKQ